MASGVRDATLKGTGYQKLTPTTSTALTVPAGSRYALIKTETQAVRWRAYLTAGVPTDPTATDGMLIDVGDEFWFSGQLTHFRVIEATSGAVLHVHYFS